MGVAETALTVTATVSPVLYAVVLAVSQILSALCALTFIVAATVRMSARINAVIDFIGSSKKGAHACTCARMDLFYLWITGSPGGWARLAIVLGEKLKIEYIDRIVVIQICCSRNVRVVAHADCEGIELIDHVVPVNIACQQCNRWHGNATSAYCDRSLGTQEPAGCSANTVGSDRSRDTKSSIDICVDRGDQCIGPIVQTHRHRLAR